jgi:cobalt-zinc-cadmium efflux system protein
LLTTGPMVMAHHKDHHHIHYNRAFGIGIALNVGFVIFEAVFGILADSLALLADAGVSLGVAAAGIGILATGWSWIDPVVSLIIAAIILIGTWRLLIDSVNLILQAVPAGIDPEAVAKYLSNVAGVKAVHDLHIWPMSTTETALTVHVVKPDLENDDGMLAQIRTECCDRFGIEHVTLQIERSEALMDCGPGCKSCKVKR